MGRWRNKVKPRQRMSCIILSHVAPSLLTLPMLITGLSIRCDFTNVLDSTGSILMRFPGDQRGGRGEGDRGRERGGRGERDTKEEIEMKEDLKKGNECRSVRTFFLHDDGLKI